MHRAQTFCPLDCPDACSLTVTVDGDRVVRLDGDERNPLTRGFICGKVRHYADHVDGDDRLLRPARRVGPKGSGELEPIGWDEALDLVARRLVEVRDAHGGEAILPLSYGGSNGTLSQDTTDARLFRRLGASRLARTVCAAPTTRAHAGLYGRMPGVALTDYEHARLVVVWGANPSVSGIHLVPILKRARKRGARLVVVDPRRTPLARQADLHLPVRPGTDLPVALSVLRWLFESGRADEAFLREHASGVDELRRRAHAWTFDNAGREAGVPAAAIARFAEWYAASSPAVIRCGWGLERNRNGGSAVAAVLALPAVAGKFGVRGGGFTMSQGGAWRIDPTRAIAAVEPDTRIVNMNRLGAALLEEQPPLRLLFVYDANPLATLPLQEKVRAGLLRDDLFTVVFNQVLTDTARYADVVLPATTFLEHAELARGYGALVLQRSRPVVAPRGEARPNRAVFAELCRRTGVAHEADPDTDDALVAALLDGRDGAARLARELAESGVAAPDCGPAPVQLVDVFPATAGGRIQLVDEALDREAPGGLYRYRPDPASERHPLALVSPATAQTISSTLGQLRRGIVPLGIHPVDAAARDLADGDTALVFNDHGRVRCPVALDAHLRPGVVHLPKGLWSRNTLDGATANALVPDSLTDLGGGACFNDARVQVVKLDGPGGADAPEPAA